MKSHRSENDEANVFKINIRLNMSEWECECELEWLGIYVNKFQSRTRAYNSMQHLSAIHFRMKTWKIPWVWQRFCFLCSKMWAVTPEWKFRTILAWKFAMFKDVIKGQIEGKLQTRAQHCSKWVSIELTSLSCAIFFSSFTWFLFKTCECLDLNLRWSLFNLFVSKDQLQLTCYFDDWEGADSKNQTNEFNVQQFSDRKHASKQTNKLIASAFSSNSDLYLW